jgi:hypothetical protein
VISSTPPFPASTSRLLFCPTSPCQGCTGRATASNSASSRRAWSLISALSGLTQSAAIPSDASPASALAMGTNAASVLPLAVPEEMSTSVSPESTGATACSWMSRRVSHPCR